MTMTVGMLITELEILLTIKAIDLNSEVIIQTPRILDSNLGVSLIATNVEDDNVVFITKEL